MRFEMKMWQDSVEPIPSRMSIPVLSFQRFSTDPGSASPAETQTLTELKSADCQLEVGAARRLAKLVGKAKRMVGWKRRTASKISRGRVGSSVSTLVAPAAKGK